MSAVSTECPTYALIKECEPHRSMNQQVCLRFAMAKLLERAATAQMRSAM